MKRRERKKEQTRRSLLDTAMMLFVRRGLHATRIEDITEAVDVAKGAFYNYFESRHGLVAELLEEGIRLLDNEYLRTMGDHASGEERIRGLVEKHELFWHDRPEYALLFHQSLGLMILEPEVSSRLRAAFRHYLECLALYLMGRSDTALPAPDWACHRVAALAGLMLGYRSFAFAADLELDARLTVETAAAGLSGQPPDSAGKGSPGAR